MLLHKKYIIQLINNNCIQSRLKLWLHILFSVCSISVSAQNISGKWVSPIGPNNSITILQLEQVGDNITGIAYKQFGDSIGSVVVLIQGTFKNYLFEYDAKNIIEQQVDSIYSLCFMHGRDLLSIRKNKMILKGIAHSIDKKEECFGLSGREKYFKTNNYNYKNSLFKDRKVLVTDTIYVNSDSIQLYIYDHLQQDGDIISLYLNDSTILSSYSITNQYKIITVPITSTLNELIVYAHNLGSIPPNTVALQIWENNQLLKKVILQSDLQKSESIVFKKKIKY